MNPELLMLFLIALALVFLLGFLPWVTWPSHPERLAWLRQWLRGDSSPPER